MVRRYAGPAIAALTRAEIKLPDGTSASHGWEQNLDGCRYARTRQTRTFLLVCIASKCTAGLERGESCGLKFLADRVVATRVLDST